MLKPKKSDERSLKTNEHEKNSTRLELENDFRFIEKNDGVGHWTLVARKIQVIIFVRINN